MIVLQPSWRLTLDLSAGSHGEPPVVCSVVWCGVRTRFLWLLHLLVPDGAPIRVSYPELVHVVYGSVWEGYTTAMLQMY